MGTVIAFAAGDESTRRLARQNPRFLRPFLADCSRKWACSPKTPSMEEGASPHVAALDRDKPAQKSSTRNKTSDFSVFPAGSRRPSLTECVSLCASLSPSRSSGREGRRPHRL